MPASNGSGVLSTKAPKKPHLVNRAGGLPAEIADLRADLAAEFAPHAAFAVEEWTDPPAASANAIKTAIATVAAVTTYSGAALNGTVGAAVMSPPRNITVTTAGATPADAPATAVINGLDVNGNAISETITVAQTATIATGVKAFAQVTSIVLPAADGTGATLAFGFGALIGFAKKLKTRAGLATLLMEISGGTKVTTATIADAATGLPNGTYSAAAAPDGSRDYAVYYEYDATV